MTSGEVGGWILVLIGLLGCCLIAIAVVAAARATWKDWHKP